MSLIFLLLLLNYHITEAFSVHQTAETHSSATSEPSKRSLFSIVWGCLSTVLICAWVSVHPNIPSPKDYGLTLKWRRIQLMLLTLIAPELMLAWAFRQRSAAKDIAKRYNTRHSNGQAQGGSCWRKGYAWLTGQKPVASKDWTATQGYFLAMGGIILVAPGSEQRLLMPTGQQPDPSAANPDALNKLNDSAPVVTYQMFNELITTPDGGTHGCDIRILEEEIEGRSKGDLLSKLIAVFQTSWFLVQCVARHRQKLAITELELLVGALASLNFFMYCCWKDKPLDVSSEARVGISVDDVLRTRLLSLKVQDNQVQKESPVEVPPFPRPQDVVRNTHHEIKGKIHFILHHPVVFLCTFWNLLPCYLFVLVFFPIFAFFPLSILFFLQITTIQVDQPKPRHSSRGIYVMNMFNFFNAGLSSLSSSIRDYFDRGLNKLLRKDDYIVMFFRWFILLPCLFIVLLSVLTILLPFKVFTSFISFAFSSVLEILSSSDNDIPYAATHVPPFYSPKLGDDRYSRIVFAFAGSCFGVLHLLGWTLTYPTEIERLCWIVSSMAITIIPAVVTLIDFILILREEHDACSIWFRALDFLVALLLFVYILARLSLIGQALVLISPKNQPPDAFDTVNWARFIFHFS